MVPFFAADTGWGLILVVVVVVVATIVVGPSFGRLVGVGTKNDSMVVLRLFGFGAGDSALVVDRLRRGVTFEVVLAVLVVESLLLLANMD